MSFSNYFGITKSMVSEWHRGLHRPSFRMLLKICYSINTNLLPAIAKEQSIHLMNKPVLSPSKQKVVRRKIDWGEVEEIFIYKLNDTESAPISVKAIAQEMNIDKRS